MKTAFSTINYLENNFMENLEGSKSKGERFPSF